MATTSSESTEASFSWNLSIKMVGGKNIPKEETISRKDDSINNGTASDSENNSHADNNSVPPSSSTESTTPTTTMAELKDEFTVAVQPNDKLSSLHEKIEQATGLKQCQQRLIYRGRILNSSEPASSGESEGRQDDSGEEEIPTKKEVMIGDIAGLTDGQTIHLVPRPLPPQPEEATQAASATTAGGASAREARMGVGLASATTEMSGAGGLLAALLGLGSSLAAVGPTAQPREGGGTANTTANTNTTEEDIFLDPSQVLPIRPPRRARRRPNSHRRSAEDPTHPTPGPLEPVRQSLMTLHTMMDSNPSTTRRSSKPNTQKDMTHPLYAVRTWYKGQWIDCRDTVHQWLEATIVDIKHPQELLTSTPKPEFKQRSVTSYIPTISTANSPRQMQDPAIGANDDQGRLRLLLEPSSHPEDTTLSDLNGCNPTMVGWRERSNNDHTQLLLVHYNGWPDRWDEWIRSDSERIRPFRTRSKAAGRGGSDLSIYGNTRINCPVPCSSFSAAPTTFVVGENEELEGVGVLKELQLLFDDVQGLFQDTLPKDSLEFLDLQSSDSNAIVPLTEFETTEVYSALSMLEDDGVENVFRILNPNEDASLEHSVKHMSVNDIDIASLEAFVQRKLQIYLNCGPVASKVERDVTEDLEDNHLPWDDGMHKRTLRKEPITTEIGNDSEVTKEDDSDDEDVLKKTDNKALELALSNIDKDQLTALAPLLDRLGRVLTDVAPHVAAIAEKLPEPTEKLPRPQEEAAKDKQQTLLKNGEESTEEVIEKGKETRRSSQGEEEIDEVEKEFEEAIKSAASALTEVVEDDEGEERIADQTALTNADDEAQTTNGSSEGSGLLRSLFNSTGENRELRPSWSTSNDPAVIPLLAEEISEDVSDDVNEANHEVEIDPDYVDFVNGFINVTDSSSNTTRRSVRRGVSSDDSIGPSLLSAYLASTAENRDNGQDAPRIVRMGSDGGNRAGGGGAGNGIDIHIHAIVTGPGGGITAMQGLEGLGFLTAPSTDSGTPAATSLNNNEASENSGVPRTPVAPEIDDDDLGLFSDLYTDDPSNSYDSLETPGSENNAGNDGSDTNQNSTDQVENCGETPIQSTSSSQDDEASRPSSQSSTRSNSRDEQSPASQERRSRQTSRSPLMGRFFRRALSRRFNSNGSTS